MTSASTLTSPATGKTSLAPSRPPKRRRKIKPGMVIGVLFLLAVFGFLYSPLITTALFSFNTSNVQTLSLIHI